MNDLRLLYREMAAGGQNFHGLSILSHKAQIGRMIAAHGAKTLLDIGCGRGDAYEPPHEVHLEWGIAKPTLYDPAFPQHDEMPPPAATFDGVVCSDVLEHVPEGDLQFFVDELFIRARKFVWASVCCRPAKKSFPDGRNLHVTLMTFRNWKRLFADSATGKVAWVLTETP